MLNIFILLLLLFIIYIIIVCIFTKDYINYDKVYNLEEDGCCIYKNILSDDDITFIKMNIEQNNTEIVKQYLIQHNKLNKTITDKLNSDYIFQDYIFLIKKSTIHTCHRDNNGIYFNEGQKHPSYTLIIYLEDMEKCLGVVPKSHINVDSNNINLSNNIENLLCNKGDIILFNANLIHVGTINKKNDNLRIQMKITHKDDINALKYYQNYNKILNIDNKIPIPIVKFQKNFTCMFPFISNLTQSTNINSAQGSVNGAKIGFFQKIFSTLFYGNSDFYDLPNGY